MSSSLYQCIHSHNRCICTQSDNPEIPLTWFPNEEFTQREPKVIIYLYHFLGCKQPCFSIKFYSVPLKRILTALFIIFLLTFSEEVTWLNTVKISKFNCPEEKWNEPWLCMMVQNSCTLADLSKTINQHTKVAFTQSFRSKCTQQKLSVLFGQQNIIWKTKSCNI